MKNIRAANCYSMMPASLDHSPPHRGCAWQSGSVGALARVFCSLGIGRPATLPCVRAAPCASKVHGRMVESVNYVTPLDVPQQDLPRA